MAHPPLSLPSFYSKKSSPTGFRKKLTLAQFDNGRKFFGDGAIKRLIFLFSIMALGVLSVSTLFILTSPFETFHTLKLHPPTFFTSSPKRGAVPHTHLYPLPLKATLKERLIAFQNAPGVGWEPADFVAWNTETCSNVEPNLNRNLLLKSSLAWSLLNSSTIIEHRKRMVQFLEQKVEDGVFDTLPVSSGGRGLIGEGRGIVFTAGNADTLLRVTWTLRLLREHLNCTLPAAIYHFPSERPEPDSPLLVELRNLNAKLVEATGRERDPGRAKNYHLKAQSIVESPWAEVIYLDSDNLPVINPELLFDAPNYRRLGIYFTPDYWKTSANNPIWHIIGVQCRDEWEQEAGQIIVDKRRHLDAMLLSLYMLTDWKFWFQFSDGDKDVFRFAMLALRKRWALPGRYVGAGGFPRGTASGSFCGHTMQQYDNSGRPAFVHYNLMKQIPSGVTQGSSWGRTKQVISFPNASETMETIPWATGQNTTFDKKLSRHLLETPYPDPVTREAYDVEADMLANSDDEGWSIYPGSEEVRRRAALERGIRPFFHGGIFSALCIDLKWENPAPKDRTKSADLDRQGNGETPPPASPNSLGINWNKPPLEVVDWNTDDRLSQFEDIVYGLGFQPNIKVI